MVSPKVATIGFFDGVHRGHRYLIEQVCEVARVRGYEPTVVTFPIHPRKVMQSDFTPCLLTACEEKQHLLSKTGITHCIMLPFTRELAGLSAFQFMRLLQTTYNVRVLVIGHDHRFGHKRTESFDDYERYGHELGIEVLRARAYPYNDTTFVSSSLIRKMLLSGNVEEAAGLLGYTYFIEGVVVGGYRIGRRIGFPTANIALVEQDKLVPDNGVYAVRICLDGCEYGGMLSIGTRPTLENDGERSIEVHIFDFQGDIYDRQLRISFLKRTRGEQKFSSLEELKAQLHRDEVQIRTYLSSY